MYLVDGFGVLKLDSNAIKAIGVPGYKAMVSDSRISIPERVADVLEVPLYDVLGLVDTECKILAISLELQLNESVLTRDLARKYRINPQYMMKRVAELQNDIKNNPALLAKINKLKSAFSI